MLLPQKKEREYRFRLALRMGLPIFALVLALIFNTLIDDTVNLTATFYIEATLILAFSIYYIFYIIYNGFDTRVTDIISKTFTREYLYSYLKRELTRKKEYTVVLISIENMQDINLQYGLKNGDRVRFEVAQWIGEYFESKDIHNVALGEIKDGDFIVGLNGKKIKNSALVEMMHLKMNDFRVQNIEVKILITITDRSFSNDLERMIENLFELKEFHKQLIHNEDVINPDEVESLVIKALKYKRFVIMTQDVFEKESVIAKECFVKFKKKDSKLIHQKSYMKVISKLGLMLEFDVMILERVVLSCTQESSLVYILNISSSSIRNPIFLSKLRDLLLDNRYAKNRIMFILSENEYYSHIDKFNAIIYSLHNIGVKIAIDKLGNNHTSFLYLRDLNIDVVRFDNFYTKTIEDTKCQNIIEGLNVIAHLKGVKTWIKMLETEESLDSINQMDIDYKQGRYLASLEKFYESKD
ncbi:MAG: GGDEF domain-containing protein [Campylobacterota bacterium]|nr:GGDEF domain-containing protein [Campylobacterota bacterium]